LHMCCISIIRSLYFRTFLASFFTTFLSPGIARSIIIIIIIIIIGNIIEPSVTIPAQPSSCTYNCLLLNLLEAFGLCLEC
jgi:hypothetical protein